MVILSNSQNFYGKTGLRDFEDLLGERRLKECGAALAELREINQVVIMEISSTGGLFLR